MNVGNTAALRGGSVSGFVNSKLETLSCRFESNTANDGGAVYLEENTSLNISDSAITGEFLHLMKRKLLLF